MDIQTVGQNYR